MYTNFVIDGVFFVMVEKSEEKIKKERKKSYGTKTLNKKKNVVVLCLSYSNENQK